jgi:hypothetical protein
MFYGRYGWPAGHVVTPMFRRQAAVQPRTTVHCFEVVGGSTQGWPTMQTMPEVEAGRCTSTTRAEAGGRTAG